MRDEFDLQGISPAELEAQDVAELPEREVMSLIGGSLLNNAIGSGMGSSLTGGAAQPSVPGTSGTGTTPSTGGVPSQVPTGANYFLSPTIPSGAHGSSLVPLNQVFFPLK